MFFQGIQSFPIPTLVRGSLQVRGLRDGEDRTIEFEHLRALPKEHQIADVGELVRNRRGAALRLRALLDLLEPVAGACHARLATADGAPACCYPLRELREHGLLVYARDDRPLSYWHGGPFHLILPGQPFAASDLPHLVSIEFVPPPYAAKRRATTQPAADTVQPRTLPGEPGETYTPFFPTRATSGPAGLLASV